ncbi:YchF/TatD family DNA exonuclease [candidate division KSB1 bacterium]
MINYVIAERLFTKDIFMFIDSHAHLHFKDFNKNLDGVIKRAGEKGVKYIINIGTDLETSNQAIDISGKYQNVFTAVGIHPTDADKFDGNTIGILKEMIKDKKVVAIGEIGLDYYWDTTTPEQQKIAFSEQLKLAAEVDLPVVIHTRNAWDDVEDVITEAVGDNVRGVFHCYSGDLETAVRLIKKGFLISFTGNITFKNFKNTEMLEQIPTEKMLLETDCPFMAPMPFRGKRNEPSYVPLIAEKLSEIKGLSVDDIARITSFNANRLFGIAPEMEEVKFAYEIRDSLYINPTTRCTSDCVFCARLIDPVVKGHNLGLPKDKEPTPEEAIKYIGDPTGYGEVVFCGYGEPLLRLDFFKEVAEWLKTKGVKVRLNTNGHGNLIYSRNIIPEIKDLVDEISVSLNTHDEKKYNKLMRTEYGDNAFKGMIDFVKKCIDAGIKTDLTVVGIPGLDIEACRKLADKLGADFRIRKYNEVG